MRALPAVVAVAWLAAIAWLTDGLRDFTTYSATLAAAGAPPRPAPDFAFTDEAGARRTFASLDGRWRLVEFLYLDCPDACPLVTSGLAQIRSSLAAASPAVEIVSVDFGRDTPQKLRNMWLGHGSPRGWTMALLDEDRVASTLAAWGIFAWRRPDGIVNHSLYLFLVDPAGRIERVLSPDEGPAAIARAVVDVTRARGGS